MNAEGLPRRVLAIGAHPDDLELVAAGTLARFLAAGAAVQLAIACLGDRGGTDANLADRRRAEAEESAALLVAPVALLGWGDSEVHDTPEARRQLLDLLRSARPDLVLTHSPEDYHDDHVQLSALIAKCAWYAASPGHATDLEPLERPPALAWMDHVSGLGFEPTHFVRIDREMALKRRMLACHRSQVNRDNGGISELGELAEAQSRLRGFQCGAQYAEAFRAARLWGRTRPEPLFP